MEKQHAKLQNRYQRLQKKHQKVLPEFYEILCFVSVLVIVFGNTSRTFGDELLKHESGFCWKQTDSQKPLSYFTKASHFVRIKGIFQAIFPETYKTLFFPICFIAFRCTFLIKGGEFVKNEMGFF
jgi:hypothetical protein